MTMKTNVRYVRLPVIGADAETLNKQFRGISGAKNDLQKKYLAIACIILLVGNFALLTILWLEFRPIHMAGDNVGKGRRPNDSFPSATHVIEYSKQRLWRDIKHNNLTGPPRPEFDEAWHELLEPMAIKISQEELDRLNDTSLMLADGSGYIAEMAVYHEMHCVKRIRQHLALDHYYPNSSPQDMEKEKAHIDHCLEYWRVAAMCRGDTSLATFFWAPDGNPKTKNYSDHICADWGQLDAFARERMVYIKDKSQIKAESKELQP